MSSRDTNPKAHQMRYGMVIVGGALLLLLAFPACHGQHGSEFLGTWKLITSPSEAPSASEVPDSAKSIEREVARKLKRKFGVDINTSHGTTHDGTPEEIVITRNGEQYLVTIDGKYPWGASYKDGGLNVAGGIAQITHIKASDHITLRGDEYSRVK